jgi:hypothetical protein
MTIPYYWIKRIGPRHIAGSTNTSQTLCGQPMLGNNYAYGSNKRDDVESCDACERAFKAERSDDAQKEKEDQTR